MKKLHLAISTSTIDATVTDYSKRLGAKPCVVVPDEYALWRTDTLNISIRQDSTCAPGSLRHLGWEDESALNFSQNTDVNGIIWEHFNAQQQAAEINTIWPDAAYDPENPPCV